MTDQPDRAIDVPDDDGDSDVGPRHAEGNKGWNEPVDDAPETPEGAIRANDEG